jgi:hypothetical protein
MTMRTRSRAKFHTDTRHTYRIDRQLDFAAPVTAARAKEVARRIMDGLQLCTEPPSTDADLTGAELICHALHRILPLT